MQKNPHQNEQSETLKTREDLFNQIEKFVKQNHSYEVAELVATPIINILKEYANWIDENTNEKSR